MDGPGLEAEALAIRTRSSTRGQTVGFDQDRATPAEGIDQGSPPVPARGEHHRCSHGLGERRPPLNPTPAPSMQGLARCIHGQGRTVPPDVDVDPQVRVLTLHGGPHAILGAQLVDDRVLDPLGDEAGVVEARLSRLSLHPQASIRSEEPAPVVAGDHLVEGVAVVDLESLQAKEHTNRRAQPEVCPAAVPEFSLEPHTPDLLLGSAELEGPDLLVEKALEAWGAGGEEGVACHGNQDPPPEAGSGPERVSVRSKAQAGAV